MNLTQMLRNALVSRARKNQITTATKATSARPATPPPADGAAPKGAAPSPFLGQGIGANDCRSKPFLAGGECFVRRDWVARREPDFFSEGQIRDAV
jgi:hypothetical protein